jgi:RNA polymerase sigma-70 factor, ECF subfamily
MVSAPSADEAPGAGLPSKAHQAAEAIDFAEVYRTHFPFVWRSLRRLGVPEPRLDDAAQEVFVVIHRRLAGFEGRSSLKSWIFGIVARISSEERRSAKRHPERELPEDLMASERFDPYEATAQAQAKKLVYDLLDSLDDGKRSVFILAELEQMTVPEIAEALSLNLNTAYSRLRAARREFESALAARSVPGDRNQP